MTMSLIRYPIPLDRTPHAKFRVELKTIDESHHCGNIPYTLKERDRLPKVSANVEPNDLVPQASCLGVITEALELRLDLLQ